MSGDMFNGLGRALIIIVALIFCMGWFSNIGCSYLCKKYAVKIEVKS